MEDAKRKLGLNPGTYMPNVQKYAKFIRPDNTFDMGAYEEHEAMEDFFIKQTQLFVEYLKHIENISYSQIARATNSHSSVITEHKFGINLARKICKEFKPYIKKFDAYYGKVTND